MMPGMFVQIPPLGCLSKESHRPLGFELSPAARAWGSISKDGWLDLPSLTQEMGYGMIWASNCFRGGVEYDPFHTKTIQQIDGNKPTVLHQAKVTRVCYHRIVLFSTHFVL